MTSKNDGGPAFPFEMRRTPTLPSGQAIGPTYLEFYPGMSLRDWFAGQIIMSRFHISPEVQESYAERAYAMADALLAARDK